MQNGIKSEKYRGLSVASVVIGIIPCCYAFLLYYFFSYYSLWDLIKDNFSSELTMMGLSIFKTTPIIVGFSIAAIVCASIDLKRIKEGIYGRRGRGLDISGIVLGKFSILLIAVWFMIGIL